MNTAIEKPNVPTNAPLPYGSPINNAQAKIVMHAAESVCEAENWPMVIAIVDSTGSLLMLHRHEQAQRASVDVAQAKAQTAVQFRRETKVFEDLVAQGGVGMRLLGMPHMTPLEGGVPIVVNGAVIGAVGVSGMHSSQDAYVAKVGIQALLQSQ